MRNAGFTECLTRRIGTATAPVSQAYTCGGALCIDTVGICPYIKSVIVTLHWAGQHATLVHRKAGIYPAIFLSGEECALKENLERLYR